MRMVLCRNHRFVYTTFWLDPVLQDELALKDDRRQSVSDIAEMTGVSTERIVRSILKENCGMTKVWAKMFPKYFTPK